MKAKLDAIVLLGPTTTGKTERAFELAHELGGAVINADKLYLFDAYELGTGRSDSAAWPHVEGHLYGVLPPGRREAPDVGAWVTWMLARVDHLRRRGLVPIIEGSSFGLASAALHVLRARGARVGALGLVWDEEQTLEARLERRVARAISAGVVDETQALLARGLGDSYVMRKGVVYQPLVSYLRGRCDLTEACRTIVTGCVQAAHAQLHKFQQLRGVRWLTTSPKAPPAPAKLLASATHV